MLWNAIGGSAESLSPEAHQCELHADDVLLLCTDGLTNELDDSSITAILSEAITAAELYQRLVTAASQAGGRDNITALGARFVPPDLATTHGL